MKPLVLIAMVLAGLGIITPAQAGTANNTISTNERPQFAPLKPLKLAQAPTEKEAFEAARDLGTIDGWQAFLRAFPTGFRSDLARAYITKLGTTNQGATTVQTTVQPVAPPPPPVPQPLQCGTNYQLVNGQCVLVQNCGRNAYRSAEGDCYCKSGYRMRSGVCQRKPKPSCGSKAYRNSAGNCRCRSGYKKRRGKCRKIVKTQTKKKKKKIRCRGGSSRCSRNSQCCSGKCCTDDFEECEGWYGKCA